MWTIRRLISTGVGAARMTEASVRRLLLDTKDNLTSILAAEVKKFLSQVDIQKELTKVFTNLKLDISASIKIRSQEEGDDSATPTHKWRYFPKAKRGK